MAGGIVEILPAIDLYVAPIPSNQVSVSDGGGRQLSDRVCACVRVSIHLSPSQDHLKPHMCNSNKRRSYRLYLKERTMG